MISASITTIVGVMEIYTENSTIIDNAMPGIVFTYAAARKVQELILEERNPDLKLRVYISGGGCSGFQYGFSFDEEQAEDDIAVKNDGVKLLVDPLSFQYLMGGRSRLLGKSARCTIRDSQPQRKHNLRVWFFVLCLGGDSARSEYRPADTFPA